MLFVAVPTVSSRMPQMNIKTRTTYEREYNDPCSTHPCDVRDVSHQLNMQAMRKYYDVAKVADDAIGKYVTEIEYFSKTPKC